MVRSDVLYHAAPLHYLPQILADNALYAQCVLDSRGLKPRASAFRRDRMLGLNNYVHLSPKTPTPLLTSKVRKGYAHAVLVFDSADVLGMPETALLPYNPKAWMERSAFEPVSDARERQELWERYMRGRGVRSLEVLVKYGLPLNPLKRIAFISGEERCAVMSVLKCAVAMPNIAMVCEPSCFGSAVDYIPATGGRIDAYFAACRKAAAILPPPDIPFD